MAADLLSGVVPGNLAEAARCVAGALAEAGETRIELEEAGQPSRPLGARATDLPGLIAACARKGSCTLRGTTTGLVVTASAGRLTWRASDAAMARVFRDATAR